MMQGLREEGSSAEAGVKLKLSTCRFKIPQNLQGGIKYDFGEIRKQQPSTACRGRTPCRSRRRKALC